jgi:hypothetical protein
MVGRKFETLNNRDSFNSHVYVQFDYVVIKSDLYKTYNMGEEISTLDVLK